MSNTLSRARHDIEASTYAASMTQQFFTSVYSTVWLSIALLLNMI
jgi:hypothetical protein